MLVLIYFKTFLNVEIYRIAGASEEEMAGYGECPLDPGGVFDFANNKSYMDVLQYFFFWLVCISLVFINGFTLNFDTLNCHFFQIKLVNFKVILLLAERKKLF